MRLENSFRTADIQALPEYNLDGLKTNGLLIYGPDRWVGSAVRAFLTLM
jgi:hypothetical protein